MTALSEPRAIERLRSSDEVVTATQGRRLAAHVLDMVVFSVTLGLGWLIWFAVVAPRAQSPGKQLLELYVVRRDGTLADGAYMWLRELLAKWMLFAVLSPLVIAFTQVPFLVPLWAIAALWCVWDRDRQCLWDKIAGTYVGHAPGVRPSPDPDPASAPPPSPSAEPWREAPDVVKQLRALRRQLDEGEITEDEYRERRQRLASTL